MNSFQVEKQAEVGIAGAEALGHMGENGAGSVNLGGSSNGFNPAAMMASMAVGNVVGQSIAGSMSGIMNPSQNNVNATKVYTYEEVKKLKTLLDEGIITEEEFNQKKKELLGL